MNWRQVLWHKAIRPLSTLPVLVFTSYEVQKGGCWVEQNLKTSKIPCIVVVKPNHKPCPRLKRQTYTKCRVSISLIVPGLVAWRVTIRSPGRYQGWSRRQQKTFGGDDFKIHVDDRWFGDWGNKGMVGKWHPHSCNVQHIRAKVVIETISSHVQIQEIKDALVTDGWKFPTMKKWSQRRWNLDILSFLSNDISVQTKEISLLDASLPLCRYIHMGLHFVQVSYTNHLSFRFSLRLALEK